MSTRKAYESRDVAAAAGRMIRGLVKRAGTGDTEALVELAGLQAQLSAAIDQAGGALKDYGYTYTDLAGELGISRQAARQRFQPHTSEAIERMAASA